jgi:hypothetical protein
MRNGIHISPGVVRLMALLVVAALGYLLYDQVPEARRYLKIEAM